MKVMDRLTNEQKQKKDKLRSLQKKPPNEQMTKEDWEELMGKNMDTYKRVRGAVRRK